MDKPHLLLNQLLLSPEICIFIGSIGLEVKRFVLHLSLERLLVLSSACETRSPILHS